MKILYIADDGTEFEDEQECIDYERRNNKVAQEMLSQIHCYDHNFREMTVSEKRRDYDLEGMLQAVYYIRFDSCEALEWLNEQFDYYGYTKIEPHIAFDEDDILMWYDGDETWESVNDKIGYYNDIINKIKGEK